MKKNILFLSFVMLLCVSPAWAFKGPLHKLSTGAKQVVTGPFSLITVPAQQVQREHDQVLGLVGGVMEGAAQAAVIPLKGLFNILTFPFVDYSDLSGE